jgi:hypothetical protein
MWEEVIDLSYLYNLIASIRLYYKMYYWHSLPELVEKGELYQDLSQIIFWYCLVYQRTLTHLQSEIIDKVISGQSVS